MDLNNCPFCESPGPVLRSGDDGNGGPTRWHVECSSCAARGPEHYDGPTIVALPADQRACMSWNMLATLTQEMKAQYEADSDIRVDRTMWREECVSLRQQVATITSKYSAFQAAADEACYKAWGLGDVDPGDVRQLGIEIEKLRAELKVASASYATAKEDLLEARTEHARSAAAMEALHSELATAQALTDMEKMAVSRVRALGKSYVGRPTKHEAGLAILAALEGTDA